MMELLAPHARQKPLPTNPARDIIGTKPFFGYFPAQQYIANWYEL
jgi:hypothetical protein